MSRASVLVKGGFLALACGVACAPATTSSGGRTEETVAVRAPADRAAPAAAPAEDAGPLEDARAVYGTIDPETGERTEEPAIGRRLREPRRGEIQAGRIRQASAAYQPEGGELPYGFRVQVVASPEYATAGRQAARVNELLGGRLPVYVEFLDPHYKVRVGDFTTEDAAEPTVAELRGLGFTDAWTVRTTIKQAP